MVRARFAIVLLTGFLLAACGAPATQQLVSAALPGDSADNNALCPTTSKNLFFAAPICTQYRLSAAGPVLSAYDADKDVGNRVAFISTALIDSRAKCQNFISKFTGEQAASNTLFDTTAIVLSGIAAAITGPASTIRGLAAGSTAVQGFKQTANADLFQQMTIALFVQQINATYFQALDSEFPPENLAGISAPAALARIQSLHRNCSIPFAAANLSTPGQSKPAQNTTPWVVSLSGTPTPGDSIALTATSTAPGFPAQVSIGVTAGDRPLNWASELMFQILSKPILAQSGVSISAVTSTPTSAKLTIQGGPSDIKWAASISSAAATPSEKAAASSGSGN